MNCVIIIFFAFWRLTERDKSAISHIQVTKALKAGKQLQNVPLTLTNRHYVPRWLSIISYPMHGIIIVKCAIASANLADTTTTYSMQKSM